MLPADVLIADHHNNRLLIIDPQGRIRWEFPRPGDLAPGQTFLQPDDAFFSPDGKYIIVTQEDDQVISMISLATSTIVYRYGVPGVPGAGPDHLFNPDDAMLTPAGVLISADIKNCRIVLITPPAHTLTRVIGQTTNACEHDPPRRFGSPNGAFPMTSGHYLITEINGDWADAQFPVANAGARVELTARTRPVAHHNAAARSAPDEVMVSDQLLCRAQLSPHSSFPNRPAQLDRAPERATVLAYLPASAQGDLTRAVVAVPSVARPRRGSVASALIVLTASRVWPVPNSIGVASPPLGLSALAHGPSSSSRSPYPKGPLT